ncbi:MAG TPA: hypothetical protein VG708_08005 [Mycobacteriales bacterium]|nr:hypothetical protein [Mycobacteriales bacterium]
MSATYPLRKAAAQPKPGQQHKTWARPRLVVISSPTHKVARGPFIILVSTLLVGGLLALLMLHTLAAQDAFQQTSLQQKLAALTDSEQQLEQQVQTDSAPAALEARARALGMVPSAITGYRRGADGRAIGHVVPATSTVTTSASTSASTPATGPTAATTGAATTGTAQPTGTSAATGGATQPAGQPSTRPTADATHR